MSVPVLVVYKHAEVGEILLQICWGLVTVQYCCTGAGYKCVIEVALLLTVVHRTKSLLKFGG